MGYIYIFGCIAFTVYGQIILKWRLIDKQIVLDGTTNKITLLLLQLLDPFILSGLVSAFVASIFWMAAMTKFELSYAYPFMSLSYLFVLLISIFIFGETVNAYKISGTICILLGIIIISKGFDA